MSHVAEYCCIQKQYINIYFRGDLDSQRVDPGLDPGVRGRSLICRRIFLLCSLMSPNAAQGLSQQTSQDNPMLV